MIEDELGRLRFLIERIYNTAMTSMTCEWCGSIDAVTLCIPQGYKVYLCTVCRYMPRPRIICLCGSTRFYEQFRQTMFDLTLQGNIVLTIGCDTKQDNDFDFTEAQKQALDRLHMRKIELADEVLVLNVSGYIGESTAREIAYARHRRIPVRFLEPDITHQVPTNFNL